jgi:hypothetical protein
VPTPDDIATQRGVGFEFTGKLDKDGRPEWEYSPGLSLRISMALHMLMNPVSPPKPMGSWYDPDLY